MAGMFGGPDTSEQDAIARRQARIQEAESAKAAMKARETAKRKARPTQKNSFRNLQSIGERTTTTGIPNNG